MNRTIGLLIITFFMVISATAQVKLKHGMILGGGQGFTSGVRAISQDNIQVEAIYVSYKYNALLGYKFRLQPVNGRSFYDIDAGISVKTIAYRISTTPDSMSIFMDEGKNFVLFTSLSLTWNYPIHKGLYVGAGIAPTYCDDPDPSATNRFDVPILVKTGYKFRAIDLSVSYKFGTTNLMKDESLKSGRINDWQLQLFIPF